MPLDASSKTAAWNKVCSMGPLVQIQKPTHWLSNYNEMNTGPPPPSLTFFLYLAIEQHQWTGHLPPAPTASNHLLRYTLSVSVKTATGRGRQGPCWMPTEAARLHGG